MLPIITEGKARGEYCGCIPMLSKQLRDLLECTNWCRLWDVSISFSVSNMNFGQSACLMLFRDLIKFKKIKTYYEYHIV